MKNNYIEKKIAHEKCQNELRQRRRAACQFSFHFETMGKKVGSPEEDLSCGCRKRRSAHTGACNGKECQRTARYLREPRGNRMTSPVASAAAETGSESGNTEEEARKDATDGAGLRSGRKKQARRLRAVLPPPARQCGGGSKNRQPPPGPGPLPSLHLPATVGEEGR